MKAIATLTLGATALMGVCANGAYAEDSKEVEFGGSSRGQFIAISESAPKDAEPITAPDVPVAPAAPRSSTVRMVVETTGDTGESESTLCVFVPAGSDESAGAISCPGGNVRVFEFGPGHGREFLVGGNALSEDEIREMVQERMEALREHLQAQAEWQVEVIDRFDSENFEREMERLEAEMDALSDRIELEYDDPEHLSPEDRTRFDRDMERFGQQMAEFGRQMARLQQEAMAEVAAELARHRDAGVPVAPSAPTDITWFGNLPHPGVDRQVIRVNRDGVEHVTIIERNEDERGNPRVIVRTTDPSSVEVVRIRAEDVDEELGSDD